MLQDKFAHDRFNVNEGLGEYGLYYAEKDDDEVESPDIKVIIIRVIDSFCCHLPKEKTNKQKDIFYFKLFTFSSILHHNIDNI